MTLFFYIIIGGITFGAFLHAWIRKEYDLYRTIIINKPKAEVYAYVRQLNNQSRWNAWFRRDPDISLKFKGEDGKPEASMYWKGNREVGEGIQRITKLKEGKVMEAQILLLKPIKTLALMYIGVKELEADRTKMVLGIRGVHRFPTSILAILLGIEKRVEGDLEKALLELKKVLEEK